MEIPAELVPALKVLALAYAWKLAVDTMLGIWHSFKPEKPEGSVQAVGFSVDGGEPEGAEAKRRG